MPKIKSKRGAAKRFKPNGAGKLRRGQSHRRHILTKKSSKRKRHLRHTTLIHDSDTAAVNRMLPYT